MKRIPNSVRQVIDTIGVATAKKLIDDDEGLLFVNIYDALSDALGNGEVPTPDQTDILLLPFMLWGSRAGLELHNIRKKRWAERPDPVESRKESIRSRFKVEALTTV